MDVSAAAAAAVVVVCISMIQGDKAICFELIKLLSEIVIYYLFFLTL